MLYLLAICFFHGIYQYLTYHLSINFFIFLLLPKFKLHKSSDFSLHRSLLYLQHPEQCLVHGRQYICICSMNKQGKQMNKYYFIWAL